MRVHATCDHGVAAVADTGRAKVALAEAEHDEDGAVVRQPECRGGRDPLRIGQCCLHGYEAVWRTRRPVTVVENVCVGVGGHSRSSEGGQQ